MMAPSELAAQGRIPLKRHPDPLVRRSVRVVGMLAELHKAGYQRLRCQPYMAPSGCYWRFEVGPVELFYQSHGALMVADVNLSHSDQRPLREMADEVVRYSSGQANEGEYFGWNDASGDSARDLAAKFVQRFPKLAARGEGWDYPYAGWYQHVTGLAEQGILATVFDDYTGPLLKSVGVSNMRPIDWGRAPNDLLPLPPPDEYPFDHPE